MGYDLHITRAADWTDSENAPISLEEWARYIRTDPEMRLDGFAEVTLPDGRILRTEGEGLAVWTAFPVPVWFAHRAGRIVVKNPDEEIIAKMIAIAGALGAHVVGDEGEEYSESNRPRPRGWLRRLFGR